MAILATRWFWVRVDTQEIVNFGNRLQDGFDPVEDVDYARCYGDPFSYVLAPGVAVPDDLAPSFPGREAEPAAKPGKKPRTKSAPVAPVAPPAGDPPEEPGPDPDPDVE